MVDVVKEIGLFVSSPGGLQADRQAVVNAVAEANRILRAEGLRVAEYLWERDARPAQGATSGQDVINRQLLDGSDVLLLIMHHKAGSSVDGVSGTISEFRRMRSVAAQGRRHVEFLTYFNMSPISPDVDVDQLKIVQEFRREVSSSGILYREYDSPIDLTPSLIPHIVEAARSAAKAGGAVAFAQATSPDVVSQENLVDEDDKPGILDLEEIITNKLNLVHGHMRALNALTRDYSEEMGRHTSQAERVNELIAKGIPVDRKAAIDEFAAGLEHHIDRLKQPVADFGRDMVEAASSTESILLELAVKTEEDVRETLGLVDVLVSTRDSMEQLVINGETMAGVLTGMPALTRRMRQAKSRGGRAYAELARVAREAVGAFDRAIKVAQDKTLGSPTPH